MPAAVRFLNRWQAVAVRAGLALYLLHYYLSFYGNWPFFGEVAAYLAVPLAPAVLVGVAGALSGIWLLSGFGTRWAAVAALVVFLANFQLFSMMREVQCASISISLVVLALFYRGRGFREGALEEAAFWRPLLTLAAYLGFSLAGASKLFYLGAWLNGSALALLCERGWVGAWGGCALLPTVVLGYFTVGAELLSLPLALWKKTRPLAWALNTLVHLGALFVAGMPPVSLGMLLLQLLLLDPSWLGRRNPR